MAQKTSIDIWHHSKLNLSVIWCPLSSCQGPWQFFSIDSRFQSHTLVLTVSTIFGWSLYPSRSLLYHPTSLLLSMSPPITSHLWSYHWHRAGWSTKQQCHVRMKWWMHKDTVCVLRLSMYKTCVSGPLRCMAFTSLNWYFNFTKTEDRSFYRLLYQM